MRIPRRQYPTVNRSADFSEIIVCQFYVQNGNDVRSFSHIRLIQRFNKERNQVIRMVEIDLRSRIPIYEQIKNDIIMRIRLGIYPPDGQLPSIRSISQSTGINVNTVKRAFADLEEEGVIYTLVGRGSFVSADAVNNTSIAQKALDDIATDIRSLKTKGVSKESLISLIESIYSEENDNDKR